MTSISISDQRLTIQGSGWARLLGLSVDVPLSHVVSVGVADHDETKRWFKGIRLAGVQIPGLMTSGTFRKGGQLTWCDVRRGDKAIVITLREERLDRLVVEVDDPVAVTRSLDQVLAGAVLGSDAGVR